MESRGAILVMLKSEDLYQQTKTNTSDEDELHYDHIRRVGYGQIETKLLETSM